MAQHREGRQLRCVWHGSRHHAAACSQFNHSSLLLLLAVENLIQLSELCKQCCQPFSSSVLSHESRHPDLQGSASAHWGLGQKTFPHPVVHGGVWHRQGVPGSATKTRTRKGSVVFYAGTSLQHNRAQEQGCPHMAALYTTVGKKSGRRVSPTP